MSMKNLKSIPTILIIVFKTKIPANSPRWKPFGYVSANLFHGVKKFVVSDLIEKKLKIKTEKLIQRENVVKRALP